jgi:hypothetical protein
MSDVSTRPGERDQLRRNMPASAPAPSAQSGAGAVAAARSSGRMMEAQNLAAADEAANERMDAFGSGYGRAQVRREAGKMFVLRDSVWTDAAHQASFRVYNVAPFSEAYFELVRALPEIAPYLKLSGTIQVAGRRASIRITEQGMTTWRAGELQAAVRAYRGA